VPPDCKVPPVNELVRFVVHQSVGSIKYSAPEIPSAEVVCRNRREIFDDLATNITASLFSRAGIIVRIFHAESERVTRLRVADQYESRLAVDIIVVVEFVVGAGWYVLSSEPERAIETAARAVTCMHIHKKHIGESLVYTGYEYTSYISPGSGLLHRRIDCGAGSTDTPLGTDTANTTPPTRPSPE
jgi:hypothetical protein